MKLNTQYRDAGEDILQEMTHKYMSIEYVVLCMLSWQSLSGYELKKMMQSSSLLYWSGNNRQIYKALDSLKNAELVVFVVEHVGAGPAKKTYSITHKGKKLLEHWLESSSPKAPEFKNPFLIQLAWMGHLNPYKLDEILNKYECSLLEQLKLQASNRENLFFPKRNKQEIYLWNAIYDNIIHTYESELNWVRNIRRSIQLIGSSD